jgi:hypothetical protein
VKIAGNYQLTAIRRVLVEILEGIAMALPFFDFLRLGSRRSFRRKSFFQI